MTVSLNLPFPPSTNNLFKNVGKRRALTDAYKAWRDEAGWSLKMQRPGQLEGSVSVTIAVQRKPNRGDIDNRAKAVLDLLVEHGVIEDDRLVEELCLKWSDETTGATVTVLPVAIRHPRKRAA
jgi:crossover junction endodeoxyribonuclease RusA